MHIVLIASEPLKEALFFTGLNVGNNITWLKNINELNKYTDADAFLDLDFEYDEIRITMLTQLLPKTVIINSVIHCLKETNIDFIRINGWHTFLQSNLIEASAKKTRREKAEELFLCFNKKVQWLPDKVGFVSPRVISMIINEAYHLIEEKVTSKEEIDKAMKMGTNYPFGPFEWADNIGLKQVYNLLKKLEKRNAYYRPSANMQASLI